MKFRRSSSERPIQPLLWRVWLSLYFVFALGGCAAAPMTLESLHALNRRAYAGHICGHPQGVPTSAHFMAYSVAMDHFETDRDPEALTAFIPQADLVLEVDPSAPNSSAKLMPISKGFVCPNAEPEPIAISSEDHAELRSIVEQTCSIASRQGRDRALLGQQRHSGPIVLGRVNPGFEQRVMTLLGIRRIPEPEPSERVPQEINLRPLVDFAKGAAVGVPIAFVPGGSIGADLAIRGKLLSEGTRASRIGMATSELLIGTGQIIVGCGGTIGGIGISSTGGGAIVGAPMAVGGATLVVTGVGNVGVAGERLLIEILRRDDGPVSSSGSPPPANAPAPAPSTPVAKPPAAEPPPPAAAKPAQTPAAAAGPAETTTTTLNKGTGVTTTTRSSGTSTITRPKAEPAMLEPYRGPGGGHHVPAKKAFEGAKGYDPNKALAISNAELQRLGANHGLITTEQMRAYRAFSKTGQPLTWEVVAEIETKALIEGRMNAEIARSTVARAIQALKAAGIKVPVRIPWGG